MTTPCGGYQFGNRGRIAPINREGGGPPSDILKVPEKYPSDAKTRIEDVNICAVRDRKAQHVPLLSTARTSYLQLVYMREASGTTITLVIHFQTRSRVRLLSSLKSSISIAFFALCSQILILCLTLHLSPRYCKNHHLRKCQSHWQNELRYRSV